MLGSLAWPNHLIPSISPEIGKYNINLNRNAGTVQQKRIHPKFTIFMDIEQFIWVVYCVNCFTNIISVNCLWALFGGSHCVDRFRCLSHLDLSRSRLYNDKHWMLGLPSGNLIVCKLESHCFRVTMWGPPSSKLVYNPI